MIKKFILIFNVCLFVLSLLLCGNAFSDDFSLNKVTVKNEKFFSLECRDADIKDILRAIAKENNLNLIISDDISATVTLSFDKISLNDALDAILRNNKLDYVIKDNIMRIVTDKDLKKRAEDEKKEYITKVVGLSYADASALQEMLRYAVSEGETIIADDRTNSLLLNVEKDNIESLELLIRKLDTKTKQIMIKAEIIETTSDFTKDLGVQWGGSYTRGPAYGNPFNNDFPNSMNIVGASGSGTYAVNLPSAVTTSGIGISFGSINKAINLDMRLSAMEKSGKINIVSKPRITTLNNKPAKIHSGITFRVRTTSEVTTGNTTSSADDLDEIKAGIDLVVTPKISQDNLIELNIDVTKSEPDFSKVVDGIPGIIDKNANTTVIVRNGDTTVIGGLNKNVNSEVKNTVPLLSKIPFLGWLFRNKNEVKLNEELNILITPILINESVANISQNRGE